MSGRILAPLFVFLAAIVWSRPAPPLQQVAAQELGQMQPPPPPMVGPPPFGSAPMGPLAPPPPPPLQRAGVLPASAAKSALAPPIPIGPPMPGSDEGKLIPSASASAIQMNPWN